MPKTQIIFLAAPTAQTEKIYRGYGVFFNRFAAALSRFHEVRTVQVPDIWVRDFLPVQHGETGKLTQLFFNPHYANYSAAFKEQIRSAVRALFPQAQAGSVCLDGGNLAAGPQRTLFALWRSAVFCKNNPAQQERAERALQEATGAEKIVWLAREVGDKIGHIDGFMQFCGRTLFVSDERFDAYLAALAARRLAQVRGVLPDTEIVYLPCVPDEKNGLSAQGVYVNFLDTSRAVFVPQYGLPQDREALARIRAHTDKPVVGVACNEVAVYGGALHCLSKEYLL